VRSMHGEGLPVARLWESKSGMIAIGLNPKGKAGSWFIQKPHWQSRSVVSGGDPETFS